MLTMRSLSRRSWRVVAPQMTTWSCVGASVADALADVLRLDYANAVALQQALIRDLELDRHGTFLETAAHWLKAEFGDNLFVEVGRVPIEQAVTPAVLGHGVVIAQQSELGAHAVRIEGGEGTVSQSNDWEARFLEPYDAHLADLVGLEVEIFDPAPGRGRSVTTVAALRPAHDRWPLANTLVFGRADPARP